MQSVKKQIISSLQKSIKDLTGLELVPQLDHPADQKHGDYSSNIAMAIFSSSKFRTPLELAQKIVKILNTKYSILNTIEKVEAVKPGFINFWLSKDCLTTLMIYIIKAKDGYGKSSVNNKNIMVEFTDPNPFKEFHIGHLYSNIVGETLSRLLEANGAIVKRANYQGDVGMHVAKALYALLNSKLKTQNSKLDNKSLGDKVRILGEAYAFGAKMFEEDESAKKEIIKINKQIYEKDPSIMGLYKKGRSWSMEYFETIYKRLDTHFDYYYFESEAAEIGINLVKVYLKKGVFQASNNAVIFPGEKYGLHNRVFINSQGFPTYEAKELGLSITKYKDFKYDQSIIVTGNEIIEYFKVLLYVLKYIYPDLGAKTQHVAHGMVRLRTGKISSRKGPVLTGEWLLDEVKRRMQDQYKDMDGETAEKVAIGAVKYALLKSGIGRDIAFNFDESISLEGNSGPYLQYTFARTQSVVRKSEIRNSKHEKDSGRARSSLARMTSFWGGAPLSGATTPESWDFEEENLLRLIYRFPEVIEEATEKFAPNLLCNFLFDLCQKFNLFYQKIPIINPQVSIGIHPKGVQSQRKFRLALTMAVGQVIKNGLYLLGISAPERI